MDQNVKRTTIKIQNQEYTVVGTKDAEHIEKVSKFLNMKMEEIMSLNPKYGIKDVAILTSMNLADLLFECSDENERLTKENSELKKNTDMEAAQKEKDELKKLIERLNSGLLDKDYEIKELGAKITQAQVKEKALQSEINELKESLDASKKAFDEEISKRYVSAEQSQKGEPSIKGADEDIKAQDKLVKQLKSQLEEMKQKVEIAENLASEFQNRAYNLELKYAQENK